MTSTLNGLVVRFANRTSVIFQRSWVKCLSQLVVNKAGMSGQRPPATYRGAGVDIDAGDALVERIKPHARRTLRPEVLGGIGGFASLVRLPAGYREPMPV